MCKIGDIIVVPNFIGDGKNKVGNHYFVVVNDRNGEIEGLSFDVVGTVMSSFKSSEQRIRKLRYEENLEVIETDGKIKNRDLKSGFIKA